MRPVVRSMLGALLLVSLSGQGRVYAEDYSTTYGIVASVVGMKSDERDWGAGLDVTAHFFFFNASVEVDRFQEEYRHENVIASGYLGVGFFNLAMLQGGVDLDGFAWRVHGELGIWSLLKGESVFPRKEESKSFWMPRDDVILTYSVGKNEAGYLAGIGGGVAF